MEIQESIEPYTLEQAQKEAERCYQCKHFPCRMACPSKVRIPEFIAAIKLGDIDKAYSIISSTNNLPAFSGRLCPYEKQCQGSCVRGRVDGAVNIGRLESFVADFVIKKSTEIKKFDLLNLLNIDNLHCKSCDDDQDNNTLKTVAIVGSGPCGLSCAIELAKHGIKATVYEKESLVGGVLRYGIPQFRQSDVVIDRQVDICRQLGIKFVCNTNVGIDLTIDKLKEQYGFVVIAAGVTQPIKLGIEGESCSGVYLAYDYLKQSKLLCSAELKSLIKKTVLVFGAGNVAMDCARTAKKLGCESVKIIYRRTENEMPARLIEINEAKEDGVEIVTLTAPKRFILQDDKLVAVECIAMELSKADSSGRATPIEIKGSEWVLECDLAVLALGGKQDNGLLNSIGLALNSGKIDTSYNFRTAIDRVYVGGDFATGANTVIAAAVAGRMIAQDIIVNRP